VLTLGLPTDSLGIKTDVETIIVETAKLEVLLIKKGS
jgi:hypothetical protein